MGIRHEICEKARVMYKAGHACEEIAKALGLSDRIVRVIVHE